MKKLRNDCVTKYSLFNISSITELCSIMRKLWNSLQNKLNNIYSCCMEWKLLISVAGNEAP